MALVASASHVGTAAHVLALTAAILVIVWVLHYGGGANLNSHNTDLIFNVHPLVMTLGFIIVTGEAIMTYNTIPSPKRVQKIVHMLLHLVALGLGILGIYAAFKFHNESQIPNMYTLHSWLGISTICLFALQWIFGFFSFWFPGAPTMMRRTLVPIHSTAGLAIFLTAVCTAETGLMEKGAGGSGPDPETRLINFAGLIILLFGLFVCLSTALPRIMAIN